MSKVLPYESVQETTLEPGGPAALKQLLALALPTVVQMASYTLMQFCDALQLATGADDAAATAAGMSGFLIFALMSMGFGVMLVVNTLVSQSLGAGDHRSCGRYLWQGVWFGVSFGVLVTSTVPLARAIFSAFGHSPTLVGLEVTYFQICIAATPLRLGGLALAQFLLAIGRPNVTLVAAAAAAVVNIFGNWATINGELGFPKMGIAGAALSTNFGVLTEVAILAAVAFGPSVRRKFATINWRPHAESMRQLLRIGIPGGLQTLSEVVAWLLFAVWILNWFGQASVTANNYMMQYMKVSFMPAFGLSAAVTALVGRYIGMGRLDLARARAHLGFKVTLAYMLLCGAVFFVGRNYLIGLFSNDPEVIRIGGWLLIMCAVYQLFDGLYIIYIGALRGAGDTAIPATATAVLCWTITVGGGMAVAWLLPGLGAIGPWLAASVYGVTIGPFLAFRFSVGEWKAIDRGESAGPRGFEVDVSNRPGHSDTVRVPGEPAA